MTRAKMYKLQETSVNGLLFDLLEKKLTRTTQADVT